MRRVVLPLAFLALFLAPAVAAAKLPFFGLEVDPLRPRVGEPITLAMTCYDDMDHTRPSSSCMGAGGTMAWVTLSTTRVRSIKATGSRSTDTRRRAVRPVAGSRLTSPARTTFCLWRTWGRAEARDGFPGAIRIEVTQGGRITSLALAAFGVAGMGLALVAWRRRTAHQIVTP